MALIQEALQSNSLIASRQKKASPTHIMIIKAFSVSQTHRHTDKPALSFNYATGRQTQKHISSRIQVSSLLRSVLLPSGLQRLNLLWAQVNTQTHTHKQNDWKLDSVSSLTQQRRDRYFLSIRLQRSPNGQILKPNSQSLLPPTGNHLTSCQWTKHKIQVEERKTTKGGQFRGCLEFPSVSQEDTHVGWRGCSFWKQFTWLCQVSPQGVLVDDFQTEKGYDFHKGKTIAVIQMQWKHMSSSVGNLVSTRNLLLLGPLIAVLRRYTDK